MLQSRIDFPLQIGGHVFDDRAGRSQLYDLCGGCGHLIAIFVDRIVVVNELVTGRYRFGAVDADALIGQRIRRRCIVFGYAGIVQKIAGRRHSTRIFPVWRTAFVDGFDGVAIGAGQIDT